MKIALAATCFVAGTLLVPLAAHAEDSDKDRASPTNYVKDSAVTVNIKARLAEEKLSSVTHIKVDTDSKGAVRLSGTAETQAEVDQAGSIARGTEGVVSVANNIRVANAHGETPGANTHRAAPVANASNKDRVEARITDMHARLEITQPQEEQWSKVAQTMRDNAKRMDALAKTRAERANMTAIEDLKSYGEISEAHADGIRKFAPVFGTLYDNLSAVQKKNADALFRNGGRKA